MNKSSDPLILYRNNNLKKFSICDNCQLKDNNGCFMEICPFFPDEVKNKACRIKLIPLDVEG